MENQIKTFSYDAHVVNFKIILAVSLPLRADCNGCISTISEEGQSYIYVTNYEDFKKDADKFVSDCYRKGMQFDVIENRGWIFTSYTYILDSVRGGGFDKYGLK